MSESGRPSQLILVRHAESVRNNLKGDSVFFPDDESRRTVRGIPDHMTPLTERGISQARATGNYLVTHFERPDYLYHSGYLRATQTMDEILGAFTEKSRLKIKVRMKEFIRERDTGYAYDMTTEEATAAFPWLREYWQTFGGFFGRPPGGESLSDVSKRVYLFLNMLFRDRVGQKVWVVTHEGTLRAFRFLLEHWTYEQALKWPSGQTPKNCGITVYDYSAEQKRLELKEYNTVAW